MKYRLTTEADAKKILEGGIQLNLPYPTFLGRIQDDCDGDYTDLNRLHVSQGPDGDMYVATGEAGYRALLRFRTIPGGTRSPRVHNALRLLAYAIQLDEEKMPDPKET